MSSDSVCTIYCSVSSTNDEADAKQLKSHNKRKKSTPQSSRKMLKYALIFALS